MVKRIYKYQLEVADEQTIKIPMNAELLSVQTQNEVPCLWALIDPNEVTENRWIEIFGTGNPVNCDFGKERRFLGTFQLMNGALIFHAFERLK